MIIGVVSDTHGNARRLKSALDKLLARGAEAVVHCGDVGSVECVELLGSCGAKAYVVWGNMDRHVEELEAAAQRCGVAFSRQSLEVPLGAGGMLAVTHGDDRGLLEGLIRGGRLSYVCHGHTHRVRDERMGQVRVVNPGAIRHPIGSWRPSAAIIDTGADTVEYVRL
jgi:hypothetical protein